jgi:hypothetical protein
MNVYSLGEGRVLQPGCWLKQPKEAIGALLLRVSTPLPQSLMSLKARAASCSLSDEELQLSFRAFAKCCEERNDVNCRSGLGLRIRTKY